MEGRGRKQRNDASSQSQSDISVPERLTLAQNLETKLLTEKSDQKARKMQMQLCEHLSDILLSDPYVALQTECPNRLWRGCFYGRIQELRSRIARESKRTRPDSKQTLQLLENSLHTFLQEAIVLYQFLVDKYQAMLLTQPAGIIPCLYRLLIHLGDLYRYSNDNNKASDAYLSASKLSPSRGNPYNQLAVIAQQHSTESHPKTCLALYWYARALQATVEPFHTSKSNLNRLFQTNKLQLQQPADPPSSQSKKALSDYKSASLRRFLAQLVDLNAVFFAYAVGSSQPNLDKVPNTAEDIYANFRNLLKEQCFGDALLTKIVAIHIFSVTYEENEDKDSLAQKLAFSCSLIFGECLITHLNTLVSTLTSSQDTTMPGLRVISPLLIFFQWIGTLPSSYFQPPSQDMHSFFITSLRNFWQAVASLSNHLVPLVRYHLQPDDSVVIQYHLEKELNVVKGFAPLASLFPEEVPEKEEKELFGYLTAAEAVEALNLGSSEQSSAPDADQEAIVKAKCFLAFAHSISNPSSDEITSNETPFLLYNKSTSQFSLNHAAFDIDDGSAPNRTEPLPASTATVMDEDLAEDEIVYTGALAFDAVPPPIHPSEAKQTKDVSDPAADSNIDFSKSPSKPLPLPQAQSFGRKELSTKPALKPPPGFSEPFSHMLPTESNGDASGASPGNANTQLILGQLRTDARVERSMQVGTSYRGSNPAFGNIVSSPLPFPYSGTTPIANKQPILPRPPPGFGSLTSNAMPPTPFAAAGAQLQSSILPSSTPLTDNCRREETPQPLTSNPFAFGTPYPPVDKPTNQRTTGYDAFPSITDQANDLDIFGYRDASSEEVRNLNEIERDWNVDDKTTDYEHPATKNPFFM